MHESLDQQIHDINGVLKKQATKLGSKDMLPRKHIPCELRHRHIVSVN